MRLRLYRSTVIAALAVWCSGSAARAKPAAWVEFAEDGRTIKVDAEGISSFVAVSSAVFSDGQTNGRVDLRNDPMVGAVRHCTRATPFGDAVVSEASFGKEDSPFQYTLILRRLTSLHAFTLQGVFHNRSDRDVRLRSFDLLDTGKGPGGSFAVANAADWLVTPLMDASPALPLSEMSQNIKEAAMFYRSGGQGFLVGPVGPAEAYTCVEVRDQAIKAWVQMDDVLVRAGESRRGEEMLFCFEPAATAAEIWTRWVAITHGARTHRTPVYGWCSWYDRTTKIDEAHVMDVVKTIEGNPNVFGKGVIQIDDGYQKMDGDWSANEKFPSGMAAVAARIREAGCTPGVWFAPLMINPNHPWGKQHPDAIQKNAKGIASFMNANPFHPAGANWINPSHPESKTFLFNIIRDARERGYGYIKIDFNGIGSRFVDPTKTRMQIFRELYALYREAAGEEVYILSCLGSPTRGVVGFVDAARVGPDSHPAHFAKCLESVLRFQIYDNVWWQNDPDVAYLAPKLESRRVGFTPEGEGMWRTWHNVVALVGGTAMISEPVNMPDVKAVWRNYELMRPGSREPARLLTLGRSPDNTIFGFTAKRPYGDFAVYNLYNPNEKTTHINLPFDRTGLPADQTCAVFDFWGNRVIAYTRGSYNSVPLEQHASALVRLTPLDPDRPTLVGSNLHLSMGATEINDIRISPSRVEIDLSDAGAQAGSLTFCSMKPLAAGPFDACTVKSVEAVGENVWRIHIEDRELTKPQTITLNVGI